LSLTTLSAVKEYLGETSNDNGALLTSLIAQAESVVSVFLDRSIEAADHTETFDGNGRDYLVLPHYPINSVSSVKINSTWDFANTAAVASTYLAFRNDGILRIRGTTFTPGVQNVQVVWNGGYVTVPKAIVEAVHLIVADRFQRARQLAGGQGGQELTQEDLGDSDTTYEKEGTADGIPEPARGLLMQYRKQF
jgi:hypothetical protein